MASADKAPERAPRSQVRFASPFRCRMWEMHDRLGEEVNVASCAALITSIERHGQKQPALGRRLLGDADHDIELIYGARRLFAARHLGVKLLVDLREIDDRTALIEMDAENRVRKDISPYERGISYKRWLREGYFESQAEIAKSLGVSESQVSRLLRFAELPLVVVQAFASPCEIREEWAVALSKRCKEPDRRAELTRRARTLARGGKRRRAQEIYDALSSGAERPVAERAKDEVVKSASGAPIMRVSVRAKTVHLILPREKLCAGVLREIVEHVRGVLEEAR